MRLSTKGRYAVMAMADLARREGDAARAVALADIAARQEISLSYLEQLFARLRRKGLVKSARGPGGGYRLARDAAAISLVEIVEAMEGPLGMTECSLHDGACGIEQSCGVRANWLRINDVVAAALRGITLAQMLAPPPDAPRKPGAGKPGAAKPIPARLATS